ncbi:hypothetical protein LCGC14_2074630 [marine sediment metagenome]|uniref:Uncharacterized protein n=1 Tax=marine sediment metagenome TaxID=412755 RepID=A0A0F9EH91_9ZZZZ
MRDVLGNDIRRGDQLIDQWGRLFTVNGISPKNVHLQDAKTGRRFVQAGRAISRTIPMLRARGDLGNQQARRKRWVKEVPREHGNQLKSGA